MAHSSVCPLLQPIGDLYPVTFGIGQPFNDPVEIEHRHEAVAEFLLGAFEAKQLIITSSQKPWMGVPGSGASAPRLSSALPALAQASEISNSAYLKSRI